MGALPDNSTERDKLREEINKIESVRTGVEAPTLPKTTLNELEYTPPTDEYLSVQAEQGLAGYRSQGIDNIKKESADNAAKLEKNKASYESAKARALQNLDTAYGSAAESIDSDVIKRGLARSSVAANAKSDLAGSYASQAAEIMRDYSVKIADIDAEINSLDAKLNAAFNDFNLSYAVKLTEKLNELKAEREKKTKEALEFNNSVKEKQAKLDNERLKTESTLYSNALNQKAKENDLDNLTTEQRDAVYKSVYNKMDEYLGSLPKKEAKLELLNHTLYRDHLSDYYYYKLYDKYGRIV